MNDEDQTLAWSFDSAGGMSPLCNSHNSITDGVLAIVYRKLITTALKYMPVVLSAHCPLSPKTGAPVQTPKLRTLQKMILSFFHNAMALVEQVTDPGLLRVVVEESARVVAYVGSSRKSVKAYLKVCLGLVAGAGSEEEDGREGVRMAAMLAVRRLAQTSRATLDAVLKVCSQVPIPEAKLTRCLGDLPHLPPDMQKHQRAHTRGDQLYEEQWCRAVCARSGCGVSACVWLYSATSYLAEECDQGEGQRTRPG